MLTNWATASNALWASLESALILAAPIFILIRQLNKLNKRLTRIEYALYNDGKTGLINKVDQLIENQNIIKIDVEVLKVKAEQN